MKFINLYLIMSLTFLAACGLKGERDASNAEGTPESPSAIHSFKKVPAPSGVFELTFATGTINPNDPNYSLIGNANYVITETAPDKTNPKISQVISTSLSTVNFPIYFVKAREKPSNLIALVSEEIKNALSAAPITEDRWVKLDGISICDEYTFVGNNVIFNGLTAEQKKVRCSFETGQCMTIFKIPAPATTFEGSKDYACTGKRDLYYQNKVKYHYEKAITGIQVNIEINEIEIPSSSADSTAQSFYFTDKVLQFTL